MTKHLNSDMERLHREILSLCTRVEEMIDKAGRSLVAGELDLVVEVLEEDSYVDEREVLIEEECLKLLALHHPVAVDLRRIATVIKVNNDMERIADLAVSIAKRARGLAENPRFAIPDGVEPMVEQVTKMVRGALDSFVHLDVGQARDVILMDSAVDELNVQLIDKLTRLMKQSGDFVDPALHCFSAIRHLERIADLATNIAEDAIYLVEGEIVRHRTDPEVKSSS